MSPDRSPAVTRVACALVAWLAAGVAACLVAAPAGAQTALGFTEAAEHNSLTPAAQDRLLDLEAAAGGRLHRIVLLWKDVEPYLVNGRPVQNWSYYDRVVSAVVARGMKPVIAVMSAPGWAHGVLECQGAHCPPATNQLGAWSRFIYDLTRRYPQAAAIEIWNEPNLRGQWATSSGPDPERYAQLFSHAAGTIHFADPTMRVLAAAITYQDRDVDGRRLTIPTFLERFYRAGGASQMAPGDGLSIHAYPWIDELETLDGLFARTLGQARDAVARFDPGRQIWLTETGATTTGPWAVTERAQAKALVTLARKLPRMSDVRAYFIHSTVEAPFNANHPHEQGYGIVRRNTLEPKLGYCSLAELAGAARALTGCPPGVLADLGFASDGSLDLGPGSSAGDSKAAKRRKRAKLRRRGRTICRIRLQRRAWWPRATRDERRAMIRVCVRRYVRKRL